jgi:hypothetical protein
MAEVLAPAKRREVALVAIVNIVELELRSSEPA